MLTLGSVSSLLSSWCNSSPVLLSAHWEYPRILDSNHTEPDRSRSHVLVLLPERSRRPGLVENVGYSSSDHSIYHRPR